MQQYSVPQFIEREAKITVFLTFKQFLYLIFVGVLGYFFYKIFTFEIFIIVFLLTGLPLLAFAFVQIEGRPLTTFIKDYLSFLKGGKEYVWKKTEAIYPKKVIKRRKIEIEEGEELKLAGKSHLKNLKTQVETGIK